MIHIIDYGAGNLFSVQNALNYLQIENKITANPAELAEADGIILPGVGAFRDAMTMLNESGFTEAIKEPIQSEVLTELGILGDFEYRNFLYTTPGGTKMVMWGNKISRPDQRNMLIAEGADIGIIQVTGTNKAEDMAAACKEMGCKVVIPHHIDYPGDYMRQTNALKDALAEIAPEIQFILPEYNKWIEL